MSSHPLSPINPVLRLLRSPRTIASWLWQMTKDVVREYREDGVGDLAAQITFWTTFSIPAAALAMLAVLGSLDRFIGSNLSDKLESTVLDYVDETFTQEQAIQQAAAELFSSTSAGLFSVAALIAVLGLSSAFAGLMRALDRAYDVPRGRPWWHHRLVAIALAVSTLAVIAGLVFLLGFVWPRLPEHVFVQSLQAPTALAALVAWATCIFHFAPNHNTPFRYDLPGALFTALSWLALGTGYAYYVAFRARGNQLQTTVGAIILALTLLYLMSVTLLVGAEMNSILSARSGVAEEPDGLIHKATAEGRRRFSELRAPRAAALDPDARAVADGSEQRDSTSTNG